MACEVITFLAETALPGRDERPGKKFVLVTLVSELPNGTIADPVGYLPVTNGHTVREPRRFTLVAATNLRGKSLHLLFPT